MKEKKIKRVALAYSGGLDTSIIIPWLIENYGCEVIAFGADLGQGDSPAAINAKALRSGAKKSFFEDLSSEFVTDYCFPCLRAQAKYEGKYLLGTSMARPLIAKRQVEVALREKCDAVAHGATGKGNDQVRFELTYMSLAPQLTIIAPWKDERWTINSREEAIDYANARKIPVPVSKKKIYSEDGNLWHLSHEGGELEDPALEPLDRVYKISNAIPKTPGKAEYVTVDFKVGLPVGLNGKKMKPCDLLVALNAMGGKHGVGHDDIVENRLVGMKSRGVYETPGGTILYEAHDALERLTLDKETLHLKQPLSLKYATLVYNGQWFTRVRESLDAFFIKSQERVTGSVRVKLFKGHATAVGTKSPYSLYDAGLGGFSNVKLYDQKDANGFIRLFGLQQRLENQIR